MSEHLLKETAHKRAVNLVEHYITQQGPVNKIDALVESVRMAIYRAMIEPRPGEKAFCIHCGGEYQFGTAAPKDIVSNHLKTCEKHPMRELERENARLRAGIELFEKRTGFALRALEDAR